MKYNETRLYISLVVLSIFLAGCTGLYGSLKLNKDLMDAYNSRLPLGNYSYYYCGRPNLPYAVIGIDERYKFNDEYWTKIDNPEDVYAKIDNLYAEPLENHTLTAADIVDHQGNKIGAYFSLYYSTVVKISDDEAGVEVYNPYNPNADGGMDAFDVAK